MKDQKHRTLWKHLAGPIAELILCLLLGIGFPIWDMADKPCFYPDEGERFLIRILGFAAVAAIFNLFRMPGVFRQAIKKARLEQEVVVTKGVICAVEQNRRGLSDQIEYSVVLEAD